MEHLHESARKHASSGAALLAQSKHKAKLLGAAYRNEKDKKENLFVPPTRATTTTSSNPWDDVTSITDAMDDVTKVILSDEEIDQKIADAFSTVNEEIAAAILEAVPLEVVEAAFYGIIDGLSDFLTSNECTGGMANIVNSAFRMIDNIAIYDPRNTMKFSIASNNLTDATNITTAYCDFTGLYRKMGALFGDYRHWENYITLAGRVGGVFISDFWPKLKCIEEGIEAGIGHDVGLCCSSVISMMLDSII